MCCKVLRCTSDVKINAKHEFHACFYAWWYGKNSLFCPFFSQIYLISCNIFFSFFSYFSSIFFRKNEKIFFSEKKKKKIFLGMSRRKWSKLHNNAKRVELGRQPSQQLCSLLLISLPPPPSSVHDFSHAEFCCIAALPNNESDRVHQRHAAAAASRMFYLSWTWSLSWGSKRPLG